jgi:AcrR family transcriptional regulator
MAYVHGYAKVYSVDRAQRKLQGGNSIAKTISAPAKRGQLSRSRILAAALELVDQDGLDALTMRRLADRLKVDPMSIYNYLSDKDALLDGLAEALWEQVEMASEKADWKQVLRSFAVSLRGLALTHPQAYGLLCRACLTEPALRRMAVSLAALERAGLDRPRAAEMLRTLFSYAFGYGLLELSAPVSTGSTELERLVSVARAVPREAPAHLVEVARLIADCDMDAQFQLGLDVILAGLERSLKAKAR